MRCLHSRRMDLAGGVYFHPNKMAPLPGIGQRFSQEARVGRQTNFSCALPPEQRGSYEQQECHKCRDRVTRQTKQAFLAETPKHQWTAWFHGDFPELQFAAKF